jgi:methyltransferase (TIGR00027 family)
LRLDPAGPLCASPCAGPRISSSTALPIIGPQATARLQTESPDAFGKYGLSIRAFMVARSRYAEEALARSIARGATQYVILGAGLDTFAYRNPYPESKLRVFEVDYPATQEWKRRNLQQAGIPIPTSVTYAPVDFEHQTLGEGLRLAGFDTSKAAFFSWLGVTMYLTEKAIESTFRFIASMPPGGGVAFDYAIPVESLSWMGRMAMRRVAAAGEPFRTFFDPGVLKARLAGMGFHDIEDVGADEINARYFSNRSDKLQVMGQLGRLMSAEI